MLKTTWSEQYNKPAVIAKDETAAAVMELCLKLKATYYDGDEVCFIVVLRPDIGPELWTQSALERSKI